jgi:hypothetical protein
MSAVEIVEWKPTPETRWYSPDRRYVPERLERRFECKASDGTSGHLWAEVYPESPFVRVTKTPNAKVTGSPALSAGPSGLTGYAGNNNGE